MNGVTNTSWMIGGPQGSGVDSSATLFSRALAVAGYWVFGKREYHSNIKGKHSYFVVRANHQPVNSIIDAVHVLATFEDSTATIHDHEIVENGALIYDPGVTKPDTLNLLPSIKCYAIDYDGLVKEIAEEEGKPAAKMAIVKNTISVAASLCLYGISLDSLEEALKGLFTGRRSSLVGINMKAAKKAYAAIQAVEGWDSFAYRLAPMPELPAKGSRLLMNGAAASGMGKLLAGCRFQTYYSITPAVDECIYLEGKQDQYGIIVYQGEDELSAINMTNGACYTGARASTATSGPGFCLMAEAIGWAGMNEVPSVIYNYMRGGPSTGLPTRNEQADILFACNIGHGDFPKFVLLPGDNHECFEDGFNAFNFAERYQTPVIVMPDKALANSTQTIEPFKTEHLRIDRGKLVDAPETFNPEDPSTGITKFARFQVTEDGISPRALPGTPGRIHFLTGDEHTEYGFITEEPAIRMANMEKRQRKMETALKEIPQEFQFKTFGPENADLTVVGFGSSKGAILDGLAAVNAKGKFSVNYVHIRMMSPFPTEAIRALLSKSNKLVALEANFSNQLAQLVSLHTGIQIPHLVCKYTGRPITEDEVVHALEEVMNADARKVVLTHGH
ncbi:MAG: 2-oxoacid:acceptor oxidoreductase subunit alpha [Vampirovibrionales bacterium]